MLKKTIFTLCAATLFTTAAQAKEPTPQEWAYAYLDQYAYGIDLLNAFESECIKTTCNAEAFKNIEKKIVQQGHYPGFTAASFGHPYDRQALKKHIGADNWNQLHLALEQYAQLAKTTAHKVDPSAAQNWELLSQERGQQQAYFKANRELKVNMRMLDSVLHIYADYNKGQFPPSIDALKSDMLQRQQYKEKLQGSVQIEDIMAQTQMESEFKLGQRSKILYHPLTLEGKISHYRLRAIDHEGFLMRQSNNPYGTSTSALYQPYEITSLQLPSVSWVYFMQQSDMLKQEKLLLEKCPVNCDFKTKENILNNFRQKSTVHIFPEEVFANFEQRQLTQDLKKHPIELTALYKVRQRIKNMILNIKKERFNMTKMNAAFMPKPYTPPKGHILPPKDSAK